MWGDVVFTGWGVGCVGGFAAVTEDITVCGWRKNAHAFLCNKLWSIFYHCACSKTSDALPEADSIFGI